jgi:putative hydrolase of the HAD superfamily
VRSRRRSAEAGDLAAVRCVAFDWGGTLDDPASELVGGSHQIDPACIPTLRELVNLGLVLVLSSETQPHQDRYAPLIAAKVDVLFRAVVTSSRLGIGKDDPRFFHAVATAGRCEVGQVLHVGNRLDRDVRAPWRSGMQVAWVTKEAPTPDERAVLPTGAFVVSHVKEIPGLFAGVRRA